MSFESYSPSKSTFFVGLSSYRNRMKPSNYAIVKEISCGGQAKVSLCKQDKKYFALKSFESSGARFFNVEINALHRLKGFAHVAQLSELTNVESTNIPLVYYNNGDLFSFLEKNGPLEKEVARLIFSMCLEGLLSIHNNNVIHSDIKPENIFLDKDLVAYIGDFGHSVIKTSVGDGSCDYHRGTKDYQAPEVLMGATFDGFKADVWSMGCVLFVMLFGYFPFGREGASLSDPLFKKFVEDPDGFWSDHECNLKSNLHADTKRFIVRMLNVNPDERSSVSELRQDPWCNHRNCQCHNHTNCYMSAKNGYGIGDVLAATSSPLSVAAKSIHCSTPGVSGICYTSLGHEHPASDVRSSS